MKARSLVSIAMLAMATGIAYYSPTLYHLNPELFGAESCRRCSHTIVFLALMIEAIAIWLHACAQEKSALLKTVSAMFALASVLGLTSVAIELGQGLA